VRRVSVLVACCVLVAAACGNSSDGDVSTDTAAPVAAQGEPETEPTEAPEPEPTEAPAPTDPPGPESTTATEPEATTTTEPEATTTTEPPPPPINVVGLVPLPGSQLNFSAQAVPVPSLVWSLFSGSGGIIVENIGGPIPPGCHSTSFFDPNTFELLQISDKDLEAYASVAGGCDGMTEAQEKGAVDGDAVTVNDPNIIQFDFGSLPPLPFEVSTQVINPDGSDGVFRSTRRDDPITVNDLSGATHVVGVSGVFEVDPNTGLLRYLEQPETPQGPGCDEFSACFQNGRFQVDLLDADGSPGSPLFSSATGGSFFFFGPEQVDVYAAIINGCGINEHFWVFAAATTEVGYELTVNDESTGESRSYDNRSGPILDTSAFATCP